MCCVSTILVIKPNDAQLASNQTKHYPWDLVGLIGPSWGANNLFLQVIIKVLCCPVLYIRESGCNLMITAQRKCIYIIRISVCKKNVICMLQAELWINIDWNSYKNRNELNTSNVLLAKKAELLVLVKAR